MEAISAECGMIHESDPAAPRQERCHRAGTTRAAQQGGKRALSGVFSMKFPFVLPNVENKYRLYFQ
jgi:hypothetical protein